MPYFVVEVNGSLVACAGSPDIRGLTAAVLASKRGPAQLTVSGMSTAEGQHTFMFWPSRALVQGDAISIRYVIEGQATEPADSFVEPERPVAEMLAQLRESSERVAKRVPATPIVMFTELRHRFLLDMGAGTSIEASLGDSEILQAIVNLTGLSCIVEVDSLSVQRD